MTPPEATAAGNDAEAAKGSPAVSPCLTTLRRRSDFLKAARGKRVAMPGLVLQARQRKPGDGQGIRVGYTCSRKVGNAVTRNRAKRRLREIARQILPYLGKDGWDYVLIGRASGTTARSFDQLQADLRTALSRIHSKTP